MADSIACKLALVVVVATIIVLLPTEARSDRLRVRGVPTFRALQTVPTSDGGFRVMGYVRDAFDQPLDGVTVQLVAPEGHPCEPASNQSGTDGAFCFRVRGKAGDQVHLAVTPTPFVDAARRMILLDPNAAPIELALDVAGEQLSLDQATHEVEATLRGAPEDEAYPATLRVERAAASSPDFERRFTVSAKKAATVELASATLGMAGRVRLVAEVAIADQVLARAERAVTLVDTIGVAPAEPLGPVRPVQGFTVHVLAAGRAGPATSGWVEAWVGDTQVGSAEVKDGKASVHVRFQASRHERVPLSVRYVPVEPWYTAGPEFETTIEVLPLPLWAHAPWVALAAIAGYWIIRAWRRPGRQREATASYPGETPVAEAVVLRRSRNATAWTGTVVDAHTREPVRGAVLGIIVPGVRSSELRSQCSSDEHGRFHLDALRSLPEAARLVVRSTLHSELRQAVPPLGDLQISLVERRRSLLLALIRWAKEMGWAGSLEPTPAHVARVAAKQDRDAARAWAAGIEQAAYGPIPPEEATEQELVGATPPLDRPLPRGR
jgi:hypothetical protein